VENPGKVKIFLVPFLLKLWFLSKNDLKYKKTPREKEVRKPGE